MKTMVYPILRGVTLLIAGLALVSCAADEDGNTGGYTGNTSPAILSASNNAGITSKIFQVVPQQTNADNSFEVVQNALGGGNVVPCANPGTVSFRGGESSGTIAFSNYCVTVTNVGDILMSGTVEYAITPDIMTLNVNGFTVVSNGESTTANISMSINLNQFDASTIMVDYTGADGMVYRIENFTVTPGLNGLVTLGGRFYDPVEGYVDVVSTDLVMTGCESGVPMSGTITATGAEQATATITFDSCTTYTVCQDNICNSLMW